MKIIFGVNSFGMGHAMRSAEIIKELSKDNEIEIITGGKSADYLSKVGKVKRVNYLSFVIKDGNIKYFQTFLFNLLKSPLIFFNFISLFSRCLAKRPDIIITDFEPIVSYTGLLLRIPVISFDNQHIVTDTKIKKIGNIFSVFLYKLTVYLMVPFPKKKIIVTFFNPKIKANNSILVSPVVREVIRNQEVKSGDYLLIYLRLEGDSILKSLEKMKIKCFIYGKTNFKSNKYLIVKKFDELQFAKDMAKSKGVICNAGMSTLSEAIYLKKPILCVPLKGQVEQELNAFYLEEKGFGLSAESINLKNIKEFMKNINFYRKNLEKEKLSDKENIKKIIKEFNF